MSKKYLCLLALMISSITSDLGAQVDLSNYTLVVDHDFGTSTCNNVRNISELDASFGTYGVAGTAVINREWQRYQPFNTTNYVFTKENLELTAVPNLGGVVNGGISSGQITTERDFYPHDGKTLVFQVRAKVPDKAGAWPAFWLYAPPWSDVTQRTTSEIDAVEIFDSLTQDTEDWTGFDHGAGVGPDFYSIMSNQWVWHPGFDFADEFHVYTLVWTEGYIQKWVDDTMVKGTEFDWYGPDPQVLINLAVGGNINNSPNDVTTFPYRYLIDYFRVYEKSSSPTLTTNRALNKLGFSSSNESQSYVAANAFDGSSSTRWSSHFSDPQWLAVDLVDTYAINRVILRWKATAYGKTYEVQTSDDGVDWTTIYSTDAGSGKVDDIRLMGAGRYVRVYGTQRGSGFGYSLYEFEVYGDNVAPAPAQLVCE